ncbi:hypothetical protein [Gordonia aichiensis]|uniref:hypothetical protein n=2 Tax=Gordonia TaxID=2053 RepID=UPI00326555B3
MQLRSKFVRVFGSCLAATALGLTLLTGAPANAAPAARHDAATVVRSCSGAKQVQPRNLTSIYCGDMGVYVTDITWLGWTDNWAAGFGTEHRKLCVPNCASGGVATAPVGIWLFAPHRGDFTRVSLYSSVTAPPQTHQLTGPRSR